MLKFNTSCAVLAYLSSNLLNEVGLSLFRCFEVDLRVCDIVVKKFTFAISSPDEFLCIPEVTMFTNKSGLRPRASSASGTERSLRPATHTESSTIEQGGPASLQAGGPLTQIELGNTLSPQAGRLGSEVVDVDQDGQAVSSSIDASQVLATVNTEHFSSSTPQSSIEEQLHPPDVDTTPTIQPPHPYRERDLSLFLANVLRYVRYMLSAVRLLSLCLSVVCLSVTLVHPTQAVELFCIFFHHTIAQGLYFSGAKNRWWGTTLSP